MKPIKSESLPQRCRETFFLRTARPRRDAHYGSEFRVGGKAVFNPFPQPYGPPPTPHPELFERHESYRPALEFVGCKLFTLSCPGRLGIAINE